MLDFLPAQIAIPVGVNKIECQVKVFALVNKIAIKQGANEFLVANHAIFVNVHLLKDSFPINFHLKSQIVAKLTDAITQLVAVYHTIFVLVEL